MKRTVSVAPGIVLEALNTHVKKDGLFFPVERLPLLLRPLSYVLPLTYGADALRGALSNGASMPLLLDFAALAGFCALLFVISVRNVRRKWIV